MKLKRPLMLQHEIGVLPLLLVKYTTLLNKIDVGNKLNVSFCFEWNMFEQPNTFLK